VADGGAEKGFFKLKFGQLKKGKVVLASVF
jgi:hypothetical protein